MPCFHFLFKWFSDVSFLFSLYAAYRCHFWSIHVKESVGWKLHWTMSMSANNSRNLRIEAFLCDCTELYMTLRRYISIWEEDQYGQVLLRQEDGVSLWCNCFSWHDPKAQRICDFIHCGWRYADASPSLWQRFKFQRPDRQPIHWGKE